MQWRGRRESSNIEDRRRTRGAAKVGGMGGAGVIITLQRNAGLHPMPHTFTHGTAEQRAKWFMTGLNSVKLADCDTFASDDL